MPVNFKRKRVILTRLRVDSTRNLLLCRFLAWTPFKPKKLMSKSETKSVE
jgi:hypothetical protein